MPFWRRNLPHLEFIVRAESIRAAAAASGVHHSTMQSRVAELSQQLDFDARSAGGQVGLALALRLYYLGANRF
ncbi:hypothetical protein B7R22_10980 [Subtercola boreus]|uniref:PucR C-terminal helix-turn-helix domain-containing protein n=1 Tax=Subtercola boreus TaxID=120213 RepID=A0A3E0VW83_9MICO|nr:helix-turn-helix domain-containing protein [Subtercola boreus]RFA14126.1 hypothetical protein B7R22_10980 [Subtercola boreus]